MLFLNNSTYEFNDLRYLSKEFLLKIELKTWEKDFWLFVESWFDDTKDYLEVHTSGSTGIPKVIRHKKSFMIASAKMTCDYFELTKDKTALICLPMTSIGGIMMFVRGLISNMHVFIQRPSSNPLMELNKKIDFVAMVPLQVQNSLINSPKKWEFIKQVIIGGGDISRDLRTGILKNEIDAFHTFGMTETISHIAINNISVNIYYKILDFIQISRSERGCLVIHAPKIGVHHLETNDLVELKGENEFVWLGRKDNAIESGGVKIIPEIIENEISGIIKGRFFISSIPDKLLNNKLILIVEGEDFDIPWDLLKSKLTKYEIPKKIVFIPKFVLSKNGKILRKETKATINEII